MTHQPTARKRRRRRRNEKWQHRRKAFTGPVSDLRFYDRCLSDDEMAELYDRVNPPVVSWPNASLEDLTLTGSPDWTSGP